VTVTSVQSIALTKHAESLQSLAGPFVDGDVVVADGYYGRGTGGGGAFYFDSMPPASATIVDAVYAPNGNTTTFVTAAPHGLVSGQRAMITGVDLQPASDGWQISVPVQPFTATAITIKSAIFAPGTTISLVALWSALLTPQIQISHPC